jgi:hypothetical protein
MNINDKCFLTCSNTSEGFKILPHMKKHITYKSLKNTLKSIRKWETSYMEIAYVKNNKIKKLLTIKESQRILKLNEL